MTSFAAHGTRRWTAQANRAQQEQQEQENEQAEEEFQYEEEQTKAGPLRWALRLIGYGSFSLVALNGVYMYLDGNDIEKTRSRLGYLQYAYAIPQFLTEKSKLMYNFVVKPPIMKLLPDQLPLKPAALQKTLVLNFENTFYSKDFESGQGIVLHFRPGFQKFISEMSKIYEIVIYSDEDSMFLNEAVMTIDPFQKFFLWNFGREFMPLNNTKHVKDARLINRDLKRVVFVDLTTESFINPNIEENVVIVPKYNGESNDELVSSLSRLLIHLGNPEVKDVRKEIKRFGNANCLENYNKFISERYERLKKSRGMFGSEAKNKK